MAEAVFARMSVDEFVHWDDGTDTRHELIDGVPVAMAPPSPRHSALVANVARAIGNRVQARPPCRALVEAGIRITEQTYFLADAALTCERPGDGAWVEAPVLVVEVLSPSTRRDDLAIKLPAYRGLTSLQEIWLVDSERRRVQLWLREAEDRWIVQDLVGSASLASAALGERIGLDELYRQVAIDESE